jgi:hypothetical protein
MNPVPAQVMGNHVAISIGSAQGSFELNVSKSVNQHVHDWTDEKGMVKYWIGSISGYNSCIVERHIRCNAIFRFPLDFPPIMNGKQMVHSNVLGGASLHPFRHWLV